MATYLITDVRQDDTHFYTTVDYTYDDGTTETVEVAHEQPLDTAHLITNIKARGSMGEQSRRVTQVRDQLLTVMNGKKKPGDPAVDVDAVLRNPKRGVN